MNWKLVAGLGIAAASVMIVTSRQNANMTSKDERDFLKTVAKAAISQFCEKHGVRNQAELIRKIVIDAKLKELEEKSDSVSGFRELLLSECARITGL